MRNSHLSLSFPVVILTFGGDHQICEIMAAKFILTQVIFSAENLQIGVYNIHEVSKSCRFTADLHRLEKKSLFSEATNEVNNYSTIRAGG